MTLVAGREIADDTIVMRELKGSPLSTVEFDWDLTTLMNNINTVLSMVIYHGSSSFNGIAGTLIGLGVTLDDTGYSVSVTPTQDSENVGAIYIGNKTTSTFTVYCTGTGTATFDWMVVNR